MSNREVVHTIRLDKSLKIILGAAAVGILLIGARPVLETSPAWAQLALNPTITLKHVGQYDHVPINVEVD